MDVFDHTAAVLAAFDIEPGPFDRLLASYLRRHRELSSANRRLVAEAAFGVMRWRRRLDGWLRMQGISRPDHRQRTIGYLHWKRPEEARVIPLEEVARAAGISGRCGDEMPPDFPGGPAAFHSFPDFLYKMFVDAVGADGAAELAAVLNRPAHPVLRVNILKASREEARRMLAEEGRVSEPTDRSPFGLRLPRRANVEATAAYRRGAVEIQDEASQLALLAADPRPGETVLDACAGAGGKSLLLAMLMSNEGRIVASDVDAAKAGEMKKRVRRAGASIIESLPAAKLKKRRDLKGAFDLVVIDAPCSGTGTLRRSPDLRWRLTPETIDERVAVQRELLAASTGWLRPGGRIAYITCSLLPCENERLVEEAVAQKGMVLVDAREALERRGISTVGIATEAGYVKTDPRCGDWDGFFAAVMTPTDR